MFTHSQVTVLTNKQTNRHRWKHPTLVATLRHWVMTRDIGTKREQMTCSDDYMQPAHPCKLVLSPKPWCVMNSIHRLYICWTGLEQTYDQIVTANTQRHKTAWNKHHSQLTITHICYQMMLRFLSSNITSHNKTRWVEFVYVHWSQSTT